MKAVSLATAGVLAGIGGLHAAWGLGSTFPFRDGDALAEAVAGSDAVPGRAECFGVAGLLGAAATLVAGPEVLPVGVRRLGALGVAGVLGVRGLCGVSGRTRLLVGWTPSPGFVDRDRRLFGPLCLALSLGALHSTRA